MRKREREKKNKRERERESSESAIGSEGRMNEEMITMH